MQIINREEYKEIPVSKLGLSTRSLNCLMRAHYTTLYLLIENQDRLCAVRNMGEKSLAEIEQLLSRISQGEIRLPVIATDDKAGGGGTISEETAPDTSLPEEILSRPATDLKVSVRVTHAFAHEKIQTIQQALALTPEQIVGMRNMGSISAQQLLDQLSLLRELGAAYFEPDAPEYVDDQTADTYNIRALDTVAAKKLQDQYGLKAAWLCEWYHCSRQRIYQMINSRTNKGRWCGKELAGEERRIITKMINEKLFYLEDRGTAYYLLNNKKDDCAFLIASDEEIKCFFLADLPPAIQALTKSQNLDRFTETECEMLNSMGHTVSVLKKQYFMPEDPEKFRNYASARGLSTEEYAQFLFGLPYCSPRNTITDDQIIACLRENTINGRTYIPSTADHQWIRSFISRSPYNTEAFISLYGFSSSGDPVNLGLTITTDSLNAVEEDMQDHGTGSGFLEELYASTPLLGSRILSQKDLDILYQNSRKWIKYLLSKPSARADLNAQMQITLAVINYAKGWDTEDESGFWRYITAQFGYRDESGQLRNLICRCVKDALQKNQRWFIMNASGNQYKSTIVVHAFSPRRSWLYFCDFLFDFYKTNLGWEYVEDDPAISRMILALRSKLRNADDEEDENLEISSKVYYFRETIIKLIIHRPGYAAKIADSLLKRIDGLVNHTALHAMTYEDQICDEWMTGKLQGIASAQRKTSSVQHRSVAIDYTRVKPVYQLISESEIQIAFPDVRLANNDFSSLQITVLHGQQTVERKSLSYYGNELGKTMKGFTLNLEDLQRRSGSGTFDPQVIITCDSEVVYNSGKTLYRKWLVFRNRTETDIGSCEQGGWSFFMPACRKAAFENAEISAIKENGYLKGWYVRLQKDFVITIDGEPVAFDSSQDSEELHITVSGGDSAADYIADGIRYRVISGERTIYILSGCRENEKRYRLAVNAQLVDLESLPYDEGAGFRRYKLEFSRLSGDEFSVRLMDLANGRLMLHRDFKRIPDFLYRFDKPFYFTAEDYKDAKIKVRLDSGDTKEIPLTSGETRVRLPYQEGELEIPVPAIRVNDNSGEVWDGSNLYWIKDIAQDRFLYVKAPAGLGLHMQLDEQSVGTEGTNAFALGNAVYGYSNAGERNRLKLSLHISQPGQPVKQYCLGYIAVREQFVEKPKVTLDGSSLKWDSGSGFIGDNSGAFRLLICEGTEYEKSYPLKLDEELIDEQLHLPIGEYSYCIQKQSGNLFDMRMVSLSRGSLYTGDINELRFLNSMIQIDTITFEDNARYGDVKIQPCFIDHITYKGIQYVLSEERECPVYSGILFFVSADGKRHEYSYRDGIDEKGHRRYQINPVRIVYINDSTLSITQDTGDPEDPGGGFYYNRYLNRQTMENVYQLTDWEPTRETRDKYYLADLYTYERKRVK